MTTLQFFNNNSTGKIDQSKWEEEILVNEYECKKVINDDISDDSLYTEHTCEYDLITDNKIYYSLIIYELELDTIDNISLKITLSDEIYKILFSHYFIRIEIETNEENIILADTTILDICLLSYLNNYKIKEDNNTIIIPLLQFNHLKNGFVYKLIPTNNIIIYFKNECDEFYIIRKQYIENIKIIFNGKKYNSFNDANIINSYYKPIDINWNIFSYKPDGIYIKNISTQYQVITFSLIKKFDDKVIIANEINEFINNQPEIEEISFQHENLVPWVYDITYMKKIVICGVNVYILPLYPEFINVKNILYYMKNSNNNIDPYIDGYKIIIKINSTELYNLHITFLGSWVD